MTRSGDAARKFAGECRIQVLGPFSVAVNGQTVIDRSWSRRKSQAIIKLLALRREHFAHREEVLDQLWPELDPAAGLNNLYKNLHHIRHHLAARGVEAPLVSLNDEMVELAPGVRVDVDEFTMLARQALQSGDVSAMEAAAGLYRGDLLPEDAYEAWTEPTREELRAQYVSLMMGLANAKDECGDTAGSIDALQALLRTDRLNEEANRLLIALYARTGSKHRALRQYQAFADRLREELDEGPSPEMLALHDSLVSSHGGARGVPLHHSPPELPAPAQPASGQRRLAPRPSPTFGREEDLERAQELIDAALSGQGCSLLVWGEAGVGKSHFVGQLIADAEDQGFLIAASRCSELESSSAYQPFRDALRSLGSARMDELIRYSPYLRRILRGTSERDEQVIDPTLFQTELFNDGQRLIEDVARETPLAICLEDLHEADEDSLRLFHFLARRVAGLRVLLIGSSRPEEREHARVTGMATSLRREKIVAEVELGALHDQSMALVVERLFGEGGPDQALLREILERAEGNPLFATEIVHTLIQEGWVRLSDGRWSKRGQAPAIIPAAVSDLLDIRLKHLSQPAQEQLFLAAVHGRDVDYHLLRRTLDMSERGALDALDECIEANVIEETAEGYRFRHELLRTGIYERLTRVRRQSLHKSIAQTLASWWPDPSAAQQVEEIARHYALSDEPWLGAPHMLEAGRRAAGVFANQQAVNFYEQVLSLAERYPDKVTGLDLPSLVETLGDIERRRGNTQRSVELFERAQALFAQAGERDAASRARGKAALGHIMLGQSEAARDQISATLQDLSDASSQHVVSRTYYLLAQLHWHGGDHRQALEAAERALVAANESEDPFEKAQAFEILALACHSLGDWQRGVELELERQALGVPGFNTDEAFEAHL